MAEEWIKKYAQTFHNLYWKGPKRPLLNKARQLAGRDDYILHVVAASSSKPLYHFIDQQTIANDADKFPMLGVNLPGHGLVKGLVHVLALAEAFHNACGERPEAFVLAVFDVVDDKDDETVTRVVNTWYEP
jgi:hypothetical protein